MRLSRAVLPASVIALLAATVWIARVYPTSGLGQLSVVHAADRAATGMAANAHLEIDVPATGDYFFRVAVHDLNSDHVGAFEVPTSSVAAATGNQAAQLPGK